MGLERLPIVNNNLENNKDIQTPNNGDDYLFNPILNNLGNEIKKDKYDNKRISEILLKLRNTLINNIELVDISYEEIDEEFKKYYRDFDEIKFTELVSFIENITKNSVEKEKFLREEQNKSLETIPGVERLNQLIYYDMVSVKPEVINIHISPNKTVSPGKKLILLRDGLRKLAEIVEKNYTVKNIKGESWIIRDYPELVKKIGFKIEPQYLKRIIEFFNNTPNYLKSNGIAKISRKDFLERYLNK
jgi:hypothetical protein